MRLLRPISIILGLAILLINTGDCVNLLFANAKEADCCLRACWPFDAEELVDSGCSRAAALQLDVERLLNAAVAAGLEPAAGGGRGGKSARLYYSRVSLW